MNDKEINNLVNDTLEKLNGINYENKTHNFINSELLDTFNKNNIDNFLKKIFHNISQETIQTNTINETINKNRLNKKVNKKVKRITINENDLNESEFILEVKKYLDSNTNPQLRFIATKILMSKTVYKNKNEYVNTITDYLLSRTPEQIDKISKSNKISIEFPKFKQILHLLAKLE